MPTKCRVDITAFFNSYSSEKIERTLTGNSCDDPIFFLKIYLLWGESKRWNFRGNAQRWCYLFSKTSCFVPRLFKFQPQTHTKSQKFLKSLFWTAVQWQKTPSVLSTRYDFATSHLKSWKLSRRISYSLLSIFGKIWMQQNVEYSIDARIGTVDMTTKGVLTTSLLAFVVTWLSRANSAGHLQ